MRHGTKNAHWFIYAQEWNNEVIIFPNHFITNPRAQPHHFILQMTPRDVWPRGDKHTTEAGTICAFRVTVFDPVCNWGSIVGILHVALLCGKRLGTPWGGAVCLDYVNNTLFSCAGHSAPSGSQSSLCSLPHPAETRQFTKQHHFLFCSHCYSCLVNYIDSRGRRSIRKDSTENNLQEDTITNTQRNTDEQQ